jgi:hypothetical protein
MHILHAQNVTCRTNAIPATMPRHEEFPARKKAAAAGAQLTRGAVLGDPLLSCLCSLSSLLLPFHFVVFHSQLDASVRSIAPPLRKHHGMH